MCDMSVGRVHCYHGNSTPISMVTRDEQKFLRDKGQHILYTNTCTQVVVTRIVYPLRSTCGTIILYREGWSAVTIATVYVHWIRNLSIANL